MEGKSHVQDLKEVLKETLQARGVLSQIQARIRAEVFHALDDKSEPRPQLTNENMLINELIREYLEFNNYRYASSVLMAESGQPETPLDRRFLTNELNIAEDAASAQVPLLYGILSTFLQSKDSGFNLRPQHTSNAGHLRRQNDRLKTAAKEDIEEDNTGLDFRKPIVYSSHRR